MRHSVTVWRVLAIELLIGLLIVIVLITFPFGDFQRKNSLVLFTFVLNGLVWAMLLIDEVNRRAFSLLMIHWSFCLLFFFYAAFVQYANDKFPWVGYRSDTLLIKTNLLLFLWTFGVLLGSTLGKQKSRVRNQSKVSIEWGNFERLLPWLTSANIGILVYRITQVGLVNLFARATSSIAYSDNGSLSLIIGNVMQAVSFFATAVSILRLRSKDKKVLWFVVNASCTLLAYFPTGIARYAAAAIYLGLLLIFSNKLKKGRTFILLFIGAFLIILPFFNAFRRTAFTDVNVLQVFERIFRNMGDVWLEGDYDAYTLLTMAVEHVESYGITWGYQFLGAIAFWIPRTLWPTKPIGSGAFMAETQGWLFTNVSCPLPAEGLINGGACGLFLFAAILGFAMVKLDRAYWVKAHIGKATKLDIIYPLITIFVFFMSRGDLMSSTAYLAAYIAVWFIITTLPDIVRCILRGPQRLKK